MRPDPQACHLPGCHFPHERYLLHHVQRLMHEIFLDQPSTSATSPRTCGHCMNFMFLPSEQRTEPVTQILEPASTTSYKQHQRLVLHKLVRLVHPANKFGYGYEHGYGYVLWRKRNTMEKWVQTNTLFWMRTNGKWLWTCVYVQMCNHCNSFSCVVELVNMYVIRNRGYYAEFISS